MSRTLKLFPSSTCSPWKRAAKFIIEHYRSPHTRNSGGITGRVGMDVYT